MSRQRPLHQLQPRHHKFIHNIVVLGMTRNDAYRDAGFKGQNENQGSALWNDPLIQEEAKKVTQRLTLERHEVEKIYSDMVKSGQIRDSDRLTALRDYSKLRGWTSDSTTDNTTTKLIEIVGKAIDKLTMSDTKAINYEALEAEYEVIS